MGKSTYPNVYMYVYTVGTKWIIEEQPLIKKIWGMVTDILRKNVNIVLTLAPIQISF